MGIICVFGDSLVYGTWDLDKGGWVNRLRLWLDEVCWASDDFYFETYDLGICGENSSGLLFRFDAECSSRNPDIIIIGIGSNDCVNPDHQMAVPIGEFSENIKAIIDNAKQFSDKLVFLSIDLVNESQTQPVDWDDTLKISNSRVKEYNVALANICGKEKVSIIDITNIVEKSGDGVHFSSEGHEKVFLKVKEFLEKKGWLKE